MLATAADILFADDTDGVSGITVGRPVGNSNLATAPTCELYKQAGVWGNAGISPAVGRASGETGGATPTSRALSEIIARSPPGPRARAPAILGPRGRQPTTEVNRCDPSLLIGVSHSSSFSL
jgi:hypothetical protein